MRRIIRFMICLMFFSALVLDIHGQITLQTDYTNGAKAKGIISYHLNVYNRITPIKGFNTPHSKDNAKLCIVRPLGGIARKGKADLDKDSYKWDAEAGKFYTDFTLLKKQIDGVFQEGVGIYQIVLDNPSWAFQRANDGTLTGDTLKVSTYGNAEPPRNYNAWANYIKEVMTFIVSTYGQDEMLKIQFGVGREIGTPTHWSGTREQFFEFYRRTVEAIYAVLPEAKIGSHFLWGSSAKAWGTDFVKWTKANNVPYDFVGVSFYPFYDRAGRTNFSEVYKKDFSVIKDIPEWNESARLEMHEFALIESLSKAGNSFQSAPPAHQNSFMAGLMKMFFEHDMHHVFQWGNGSQFLPLSTELKNLQGNVYFRSTKSGSHHSEANYVDAFFTKDSLQHQYSIMAYNYSSNPASVMTEELNIAATIAVPPGTKLKYRFATFDQSKESLVWSDWQETSTKGRETIPDKSMFSFDARLPAFSFLKYEIRVPGSNH